MGLFSALFGTAMGYSVRDVLYWERAFPDGVTRCEFGGAFQRETVSILTAIRHVQNSHGWTADESSYAIFCDLERGECVPTACGRYFYVHEPSRDKAAQAAKSKGPIA